MYKYSTSFDYYRPYPFLYAIVFGNKLGSSPTLKRFENSIITIINDYFHAKLIIILYKLQSTIYVLPICSIIIIIINAGC